MDEAVKPPLSASGVCQLNSMFISGREHILGLQHSQQKKCHGNWIWDSINATGLGSWGEEMFSSPRCPKSLLASEYLIALDFLLPFFVSVDE